MIKTLKKCISRVDLELAPFEYQKSDMWHLHSKNRYVVEIKGCIARTVLAGVLNSSFCWCSSLINNKSIEFPIIPAGHEESRERFAEHDFVSIHGFITACRIELKPFFRQHQMLQVRSIK